MNGFHRPRAALRLARTAAALACLLATSFAHPCSAQEPARESRPDAPQMLRGGELDEALEANGVLATERAVLSSALSLGRARRAERARVDREALEARAVRRLEDGERFTSKLAPASEEESSDDEPGVALAVPRASSAPSETAQGGGAATWVGLLFGLAGFGAYVGTRLRGR